MRELILEYGFKQSSEGNFTYKFYHEGEICFACLTQKKSIFSHLKGRDIIYYELSIMGTNDGDCCEICEVKSIEDVKKHIQDFDPKVKFLNKIISFFMIYLVIVSLILLIK